VTRAELYRLLHRGSRGDLEFYRRTCHGKRTILELGSGYGRVLRALAEPNRHLVGIERDGALRRMARREIRSLPGSVEVVAGDMRTFELDASFERILVPYSGIYCLTSKRDLVRCLRRVRRHLAPGGQLVFDAYRADRFHALGDPRTPDGEEPLVTLDVDGRIGDVFESSRWSRSRQRLDVEYDLVTRGSRRRVSIRIAQRYWLDSEVDRLLARAGLRALSIRGGFHDRPLGPRSEVRVVRAVAA
jgi:SAM-dependent methyltransferase